MKTRGWILTVICSMLLLVAGITFASMVLVGQPALANESLWWWILINLGVMVLLFGYGVKRGNPDIAYLQHTEKQTDTGTRCRGL